MARDGACGRGTRSCGEHRQQAGWTSRSAARRGHRFDRRGVEALAARLAIPILQCRTKLPLENDPFRRATLTAGNASVKLTTYMKRWV